jgi:hypothetical protein
LVQLGSIENNNSQTKKQKHLLSEELDEVVSFIIIINKAALNI